MRATPKRKRKGRRDERCFYCSVRLVAGTSSADNAATKDHIHPKSKGGTRKVPCCRKCNQTKRDMTYSEWIAYRAQETDHARP